MPELGRTLKLAEVVHIRKPEQEGVAAVRGLLRGAEEARQTPVVEAAELRTAPHKRTWSSPSPCSCRC
jgi:hypothetical protein